MISGLRLVQSPLRSGDTPGGERSLHCRACQCRALVDEAGNAPRRRHVDEHRAAARRSSSSSRTCVKRSVRVRGSRLRAPAGSPRSRSSPATATAMPMSEAARPFAMRRPSAGRLRLLNDHAARPTSTEPGEGGELSGWAYLLAQHPHQPGHRGIDREGQQLPQRLHPGAGLRQAADELRRKRQEQERQRQAEPECQDHGKRQGGRLGEGEADRVPMNGAVQRLATTAAAPPREENDPASPERRVSPWPRPCSDDPRWNTPERLKPIASNR